MKKVILFSLAVAALASCSKENSPIEEGEKEIGTLSVAASFGISVEEENAFVTKDVIGYGTPDFGDFSYYVTTDGTTLATALPLGSNAANTLTAWGEALDELTLYAGTYKIVAGNVAPSYNIAADTDLPTTALSGVKYLSVATDADVAASAKTTVSITNRSDKTAAPAAGEWKMLNTVINVVATNDAAASFFAALNSYTITVGGLELSSKTGVVLATTAITGNQGYFAPAASTTVELKYVLAGASEVTKTMTYSSATVGGSEYTFKFASYNGTIEVTAEAPNGETTSLTEIDFAGV